MAPFFSFHPSRIRLSGDLFHGDAPDRCLSPALRKIAMASGVLWCQSHAQQPQCLYLVCLIRQFFHSAQHDCGGVARGQGRLVHPCAAFHTGDTHLRLVVQTVRLFTGLRAVMYRQSPPAQNSPALA